MRHKRRPALPRQSAAATAAIDLAPDQRAGGTADDRARQSVAITIDLAAEQGTRGAPDDQPRRPAAAPASIAAVAIMVTPVIAAIPAIVAPVIATLVAGSEEHTSELQSLMRIS